VWSAAMIIERLSQEHRNIEKLLAVLEREFLAPRRSRGRERARGW
jgi:hypothetical protein